MNAPRQDGIAFVVFCAVIGCWVFLLTGFVVRARRIRVRETRRQPGALLGMVLQFLCYGALWLPQLQRERWSPIVLMSRAAELALAAATLFLAAASIWLVDAASRRLGKQWALPARLVEGHELITSGPYRWVRTPIYLGMLALLLATGLALSPWPVLVIAAVVFIAGTVIRIRNEEQLLRQAFGAKFEEYTRTAAALIPGIY